MKVRSFFLQRAARFGRRALQTRETLCYAASGALRLETILSARYTG